MANNQHHVARKSSHVYWTREGEFSELSVGDVNNGNYLGIGTDGTLTLNGDATVWDDLRFPAVATKLQGTKDPDFSVFLDDGSGSQGVFTYLFDKATEEELYLAAQIPHTWKAGSTLRAHFHWSPMDTDTGDVVWGLEYSWANINATYGDTTIVTVTDTGGGTAKAHQMTSVIQLDGTGKTASSQILMRIFRDATNAADTYDNDAALLEFDIHYEIDKMGDASLP